MRRFISRTLCKIDRVSQWSGNMMAVFLFVLVGMVMFEVISRYIFNHPTVWGLEASPRVFGPFALGSGAYALLHKGHVKMDIFYDRWSERTKAIVDACTFLVFMMFIGIILWKSASYGWQSFLIREHSVTAWSPPIYLWKLTVPLAALLLALQGIADFIRNLTFAISGKKLT
jgi:TRAP-type mannitol/chloroaromatic compound transport system permease small subunit